MRMGYLRTPARAVRSPSPSSVDVLSSSSRISPLNARDKAWAASTLLPFSRSDIMEREAWEMEQPCPWIATCWMIPSTVAAWRATSSPQKGLVSSAVMSGSVTAAWFLGRR